jgi:thiol:disulfide interchange protein DsbC
MNMNRLIFPVALAGLVIAMLAVAAETMAPAPAAAAAPNSTAASLPQTQPESVAVTPAELAAVAAHVPGAKPGDIRATPIPGIYEFRQGADIVYVTADGRFGISGDIYRVADKHNLTESRRRELRLALISAIPESSMVVFAPSAPKYTVTVFTDVDCGYCRELHKHIDEYNRLGVKVRYLFFPRSGPDTESWTKAEQVWCSADRRSALTQAKQGTALKASASCANPVAQTYALGRAIGLDGTPGIVTENGSLLPGYAPPDILLQELQQEDPPPGKG